MTVGIEIDPGWAWDDKYPLAQAVKVNDLLFVSGQVPIDPNGNLVGEGDVVQQTRQVFDNIDAILKRAGGTLQNVVKVTAYLTDIGMFQEYNHARAEILKGHRPASTTVVVAGLAITGLLVEVDAIAHL